MKIFSSEYEGRLQHWMRVLQDDFYKPLDGISFDAAHTMDELSLEEAQKLTFTKVEPGYVWGNVWEYCWFRGTIKLPEQAKGHRIVMDLKPGGESTLFVNGQSFGTYRASWVQFPHHYMEDNFLTAHAAGDEIYEVMMETYAGHDFPEAPGGTCATGPVLPGSYAERVEAGDRRVLGKSTFGIWNEDAYQLFMDVDTLYKLLQTLDTTSLRAVKVAEALEKFTLIVDFEQDEEKRNASYRAAREALKPALAAVNGTTAPDFFAIGNAHLDLAWLWPMAETDRKTARTFAAQLRLLEEYPDYHFLQSQPAAYEMCRAYSPELFERIRQAIKDGRWIAEGAMWVEPDTNLAGGEALVRQLLYGLDYYKNVLGTESRILWLPDTFGYSGALPQILKKSGVKYLVTQKIFWSYNDGERFPYHYFTWQGIDGTEVTAFLPTSYTYRTDPQSLNEVWQNRSQERDLENFLIPFGYGDGGGGPSRDYLEYLDREKNLEGMPRVRQGNPVQFFEELQEQGGPKNTYVGELYFDAHRGTYTPQAIIKKNNRQAEIALREMEFWGAAAMINGLPYDNQSADTLWKELLLHQFHDILPGSGIARLYTEADARVKAVIAQAGAKATEAAAALVQEDDNAVTIFNSLSFPRQAMVKLPEQFKDGAVTREGTPVPVEVGNDGVQAIVSLPSAGSVTLVPATAAVEPADCARVYAEGDGFVLQNNLLRARINRRGEITSLVLLDSGREFAADAMNRFRFYKDVPRIFDAWDIDSQYIDQELPGAENITVTIACESGLSAALKVTGTISESTFEQTISLRADARRVEFDTVVDWHELHRLLKVSFPAAVYAENGINEVQFGYVERPTHRSRRYDKDRFEVCNHRYSALCDGSHGVAVLNDCKYGISMNGNAMELTLLRAAASPEMRADNGIHRFTYAVSPFEGAFAESDVVRQGLDLNVPAQVVPGSAETISLVQIDRSNVLLDTLKPAQDGSGDLILRFYEAQKAACTARVQTKWQGKAWICDLLENKEQEIANDNGNLKLEFGPFEIITVRISPEGR